MTTSDALSTDAWEARAPKQSVLHWPWPSAPHKMVTYDKNNKTTSELCLDAAHWTISVGGRNSNILFADGEAGLLQRKLTIVLRTGMSPQAVCTFATLTVKNWSLYCALLENGPIGLTRLWEAAKGGALHEASTAKTILRYAAEQSLGPWQPAHLHLIETLPTQAWKQSRAAKTKLRGRVHQLPVRTNMHIVRVLDEAALEESLSERELEGFAALAFEFQHAVRPSQVIQVELSDLLVFPDAAGALNCVIRFLPIKNKTKSEVLPEFRSIKTEWCSLFVRLKELAERAGRDRVWSRTTTQQLKTAMSTACRRKGLKTDFSPTRLRHNSTQLLADAGHSRESLRRFLTHRQLGTAAVYHGASLKYGERINAALGASKVYKLVVDLAEIKFISTEQLLAAPADEQIGGVVGDRLVAGIGRCKTKQIRCPKEPVAACYGCSSFIPCADLQVHREAVDALRAQVQTFLKYEPSSNGLAPLQLREALSTAQATVALLQAEQ